MNSDMGAIDTVDARSGEALEKLTAFLAIPSISTDPAYAEAIERCAGFVLSERVTRWISRCRRTAWMTMRCATT
jgi:hypothetical protein